ncbi:MAG: 1-(5-phosphoribosyl)-5-[(5-phosphoribosylamino)methylideneamino]imidazole-4-carboxamide isomerase [Bacteroidales bacterium]|nr:1-(5-phosphoribosyl)-5-[(5-phosphoribosylamino)methylideneamino]imidazole-4-carboxamide isomerase [Bacteroidales bacterium]
MQNDEIKINSLKNSSFNVIPAMDIIGGECVRLSMGDYTTKKIYSSAPEDVAVQFEQYGMNRLHIVDLDGAKMGTPINTEIIERVLKVSNLSIQFGGGVRTISDAERVFSLGASRVIIGSAAVQDPAIISSLIKKYGKNRVILGVDIKDQKIAINGWIDKVDKDIDAFISFFINMGVGQIICTDISKDGMLSGPSFDIYMNLLSAFPFVDIIASGGVRDIKDIKRLKDIGLNGVIVGKALYEKRIDLNDLKSWLQKD